MRSKPRFAGFPHRSATPVSVRRFVADVGAIVAGGLVLALELWTVVPAPNIPTLALAAVVPEITPWAAASCLFAGLYAQLVARGWPRTFGVMGASVALGFALVPWCLLPGTVVACDREMRLAGIDPAPRVPPGGSGARPYDIGTALAGFGGRSIVSERLNLPVRTRDGARLGLDLYAPVGIGARPTVLLLYGGAWIFGNRGDSAELARALARDGYTAIALDYRHAPQYRFPTQIDDVRDAIAAIARHARAWRVDPRRVAILGRSAGAELALIAAYDPEPLTVRAAIGYYAPIDLAQGYRLPPRPDPADVRRILRAYIGAPPEERMSNYVAGSPLAHVRPGLPPTLLVSGGRDELVRNGFSHEMRTALRGHGNRVAALDLPWSNHAFDSIPNGTGGQLARYYTERFLAAVFAP